MQQVNPNNELSYSSSLESKININGYNLYRIDDNLNLNISNYQSKQNNEDNKILPTILPFINYYSGLQNIKSYKYSNTLETYNIFRDKGNSTHAQKQIKISSKFLINKNIIKYGTKINYGAEIYNQFFSTYNKKINSNYTSSDHFRSFPIIGIKAKTPFKFKKNLINLTYIPQISIVLTPGISNTEKISNEDSSINSYTIETNDNYNRYTGSDKLDNSKRINFSFGIKNDNFNSILSTTYEFTNNSNYHYEGGNEKKLSDVLGDFNLKLNNFENSYNFRFDPHYNYMKSQNYNLVYKNSLGDYKLGYLDEKSKSGNNINSDNETLNYRFESNKYKYSKISYFGLYDFKKSINKESGLSYSYFDECFGVNVDFKRNSYKEEELKPQDIMTIMFSFKNIGSYKSTNLAVSETDKQDIEWESKSIDDDLFN